MSSRASLRLPSILLAGLLAGALCQSILGAGRKGRVRHVKAAAHDSVVRERVTPFRVGEQLDYRVAWANLVTAATAQLAVTEQREFYRWQAWHFQAQAHTLDPLRILFPVDDQFDSYADTATLTSHQYELYLNEQGKPATRIVRMSAPQEAAWGKGPLVIVLPGTRDPLAALYYLRTVDWQGNPEVRSSVYDGNKFYEMRARLEEARSSVAVPAGNYTAARIGIRVFQNGQELSNVHFTLWLAQDPARTPVLIEGEVPIGTVRGELLKAVE